MCAVDDGDGGDQSETSSLCSCRGSGRHDSGRHDSGIDLCDVMDSSCCSSSTSDTELQADNNVAVVK